MQERLKKQDMLENETELVERAKNDDKAFEVLYDFYFPKIYGYMIRRVGSVDVAQDLTSVTFVNVFNNLGRYAQKGYPFSAWVYRIATNNLIDHYRKSGRRKEINIDDVAEPKDESSAPDELAQTEQESEATREVLKTLSEKHQQVLSLKFFADKSNKEIAEALGTNENNVRVLMFRALKSFKEAYNNYERK